LHPTCRCRKFLSCSWTNKICHSKLFLDLPWSKHSAQDRR
jgi:hypothetical protein